VNQTPDSFKNFAAWLAALFLTALGAQLWIVWLYGSPLPMWDQWYEASDFFKPWVAGHLKWTDFFAAHNEHRIFATRLLDVTLIEINGRWDPLLQMAVNAFIHAAFACGLAFCLWDFLGRIHGWLVCAVLAFFFALPYAGENATWGFNSQDYFVNIFALVAIVGLGFGKVGRWLWWIGLAAAILGLFNMASGLLAPLAVGGLLFLRSLKSRRLEKGSLISITICLAIVALGTTLNVTKEQDRAFQAHSFMEFTAALTRNLSWPFYNAPFMPCLILIPLALLLAFYLRPNFQSPRAAEFLLVLALWSALQSVAMAYGRANYGGNIFPVSRYTDWFNIFVIAAVFAVVLLVQLQESHWFRNRFLGSIFVVAILCGVIHISPIVVNGLVAPNRMWNLAAEERVERFLSNGNESDFLERPTVRPDPQLALTVLRDPQLQTILPVSCLPPSPASKPGRLAGLTQSLLTHSFTILCAGLILFVALCGYGLVRGGAARMPVLGIPVMSLTGIFVLSTGLVALCVVWSNRSVSRESVERDLQHQLAAQLKAAGNLQRAAIHEQKAEDLKKFKLSPRG
jgi:hypothetical protein